MALGCVEILGFFSNATDLTPARASNRAAIKPHGPPPTIATAGSALIEPASTSVSPRLTRNS
jgi:hypothetical protein